MEIETIVRGFIHFALHILVPGLIAKQYDPKNWKRAWCILILTMAVDLDHFFANPIFDPNRMSVGFHYLHSYPAICIYIGMLFHINGVFILIASGIAFFYFEDSDKNTMPT